MRTQLTFQCPHCDQDLLATEEHAGHSFDCPSCTNMFTVPANHALVVANKRGIMPEDIDNYEEYGIAHRGHYHDDSRPVEMRLGKLAGMKIDVDKKTRNAMATTFLGGLLVALGAIVFAMFGGKGKSA